VAGNVQDSKTIEEIAVNPVTADDHILGNPNADVIIIEFSDTECPFCKVFHQTMKRIMNDYGKDGRVAWVYRHFPIDGLHKLARSQAHATECVAELGGNEKFWEFTDLIYARTQSNDGLPLSELPKMAGEIGINVDKFNECQNSNKYANIIIQDEQDAQRSGGRGTPHSILITKTGEKIAIKGAQPYDVIKSIVDAALNSVNTQ
jgi:protein-disulfide isomerase